MGGDYAPHSVIEGAALALKKYSNTFFTVFGDQNLLDPLIEAYPILKGKCDVVHTDVFVTNSDKPAAALRVKDSSMRLAIEMVERKEADGVVSGGNTGAYMALSKIIFRTIPGISRPAIATIFPTQTGQSVMLDMGANLQCDENILLQFAIMGNVYAKDVLNIKNPTVGLLNVGSEEMKGHPELQAAANLLKQVPDVINFHGYVEGNDISAGTVDVIVTDGFTGNIAIKTAEGFSRMVFRDLKAAMTSSLITKIGLVFSAPAIRIMRNKFDPQHYNGAMFIGLNGVAIKSHGSAEAPAFANAIGVAHKMIFHEFNKQIERDLAAVQKDLENEKK